MNFAISPDGTMLAADRDDTILLWDLARPLNGKAALPTPKNAKEAEALWEKLGDPDPAESDRALWALVAAPEQALTLMKDRLKPAPGPDAKRVQELVKHLDSAKFNERDTASKALLALPTTALPVLRAARKDAGSLEQRRRLDEVIVAVQTRLESAAANLRELRALEVLERIGGDQARQRIAAIAAGADGAIVTFEAQLILARWR